MNKYGRIILSFPKTILVTITLFSNFAAANEIHEFLQDKMDYQKSLGTKFHHKKIKKEPQLEFTPDIRWLSAGKMQMAIEEFYPNQLGNFTEWDIDSFHQDTDLDSGFMTLGKSAIIYENKLPEFFSSKHYMNRNYLKCAFNGVDIQSIDSKQLRVDTLAKIKILGIKIASIRTSVFIKVYDDVSHFLDQEVPVNMHATWLKMAQSIPLPLERISTTRSGKFDIIPNKNSIGGRTTNFYYNIDNKHTFHVSIKVISLKNVPGFVRNSIKDHQYTGTWESLNLIRNLPKILKKH